jgi:nucleotide-binding universal stress UspA family protein
MYKSILVATDLLPTSLPALRAALKLAHEQEAKIGALYVVEVWMVERQWFTGITEQDVAFHRAFLEREAEAARQVLREQTDRVRAEEELELAVDALVRDGRAVVSIATVAAERDCDLIVIGTRGRPTTLGSVAEQVVRTAGRSVLVIPA